MGKEYENREREQEGFVPLFSNTGAGGMDWECLRSEISPSYVKNKKQEEFSSLESFRTITN